MSSAFTAFSLASFKSLCLNKGNMVFLLTLKIFVYCVVFFIYSLAALQCMWQLLKI